MNCSVSEDGSLCNEFISLRFREKLKNDSIKLWLPPYYSVENKGQSEEEKRAFQELVEKFAVALNLDISVCHDILCQFQQNALKHLQERSEYKETGVATIRVKVSGAQNDVCQKTINVSTKLDVPVSDVQKMIADKLGLSAERLKLIAGGQVMKSDQQLMMYGIQNGCQLMAIILGACAGEKLRAEEVQLRSVQQMRADIGLLANSTNQVDPYLQITDQAGNSLYLPDEERRSLVTAMTLHEKGRAAMKRNDYALALIFLLEADKEFSSCRSQLLERVDNFALLNMDIAWCYLFLENLALLPDAEQRLKQCEAKFKYSYGPNLERIVELKGSAGNEATLLLRLHLLQGIVLFHQNKTDAALILLNEAKAELTSLKQIDSSLPVLLQMGFTPAEGRLGLRATKGHVEDAIVHIEKRRQELKAARERDGLERESRKMGKCVDGQQWVSEVVVSQLVGMGFQRELAVEAARNSNNVIHEAITLINEQPHVLTQQLMRTLLHKITDLGFLSTMAKLALRKNNFNVERAIEELTVCNGYIEGEVSDEDIPSTSTGKTLKDAGKILKRESEAFSRIREDINETGVDDYLDSTLEEEERFLLRYLSILQS
ncbi:NEDD8 ultimate buster 1 isoform X2 [Nilaparvata lugens]|uniref:NEDD8 ultimate buster 1 isoform X2 n=1 Tax=Nilaparvata lugens TaxID=108931 RepID=UPI00193D9E22|nr:NEDD8 ultimate buster 1 isoform X2 [Nilaparvata lugens]